MLFENINFMFYTFADFFIVGEGGEYGGGEESFRCCTCGATKVYWPSKHHDVRSWISTCTCAFANHGRKKRKHGVHHSLDLGRFPLHVLSLDLYKHGSTMYRTLLDLFFAKLFAFKILEKSASPEVLYSSRVSYRVAQ